MVRDKYAMQGTPRVAESFMLWQGGGGGSGESSNLNEVANLTTKTP